jgi:peptidoglycan lytic transglycosylase
MAIARRSESTPTPRPYSGNKKIVKKTAGHIVRAGAVFLVICAAAIAGPRSANRSGHPIAGAAMPAATKSTTTTAAKPAPKTPLTPKELEQLSRALKQKDSASAFARLSAFANQKSSGELGLRASLALGYYEYSKTHYASASQWLEHAQADPLLQEYATYWSAENDRALNRNAEALKHLKQLRQDFPNSVMTEQVLHSLAEAALALNQPEDALAALNSYSYTSERPGLLFLRAEAQEQAGHKAEAAEDYQTVYLRFPLSEQGPEARLKLVVLRSSLKEQLPPIPLDQRLMHADAVFKAKYWSEARSEYAALLADTTGAERERTELRVLICGLSLGAGPSEVSTLKITDPDVNAERYFAIANWYRNQQQSREMEAAVESAASAAPLSRWTESALFLAGNYYWTQLDRDRATGYYKRLAENFPGVPDATAAQWRVAWTAVLKREPNAALFLSEHIRLYPGSAFTPDALYWLGRLAEEAGNAGLARAYYQKLRDRYSQNYFTTWAVERLQSLGPGTETDPDVLASIPAVPPVPPLGEIIPPAAAERQARANALRSIAFDSSAELELRAAYAATGEPRLLLEAAQEAVNAGHYGAGFAAIRQLYPQLEARPFAEVPREVWLTAYPLAYEDSIRRWSGKEGVDPMLTAGLIRQESAFQPEARSGANAIGLMQLLPKTARRVAGSAKIRYSHALLFDPDYNVHLGTIYFAGLRKDFGSVESALAAYNAGEERVGQWTSGQNYREIAEFVDSIPFTETREYVQIVTRNAEIYRKLYGASSESRPPATRRKR